MFLILQPNDIKGPIGFLDFWESGKRQIPNSAIADISLPLYTAAVKSQTTQVCENVHQEKLGTVCTTSKNIDEFTN